MKNLFYSKLMLLLMGVLSVAMNARAQFTADSPWVFEAGQTYEISSENFQFKDIYAVYTPSSNGVLTMTYVGTDELSLYTDATYAEFAEIQPEWQGSFSPRIYELNVVAGQTYYFHRSFIMNYGNISISFGETSAPLTLTRVTPAEDQYLLASVGQLSVEFSKPVSHGAATLSIGSTQETLIGNGMMGVITFETKSVLMNWYNNGILKEGDDVVLTINDVCSSSNAEDFYGTDGTFVQSFKVGAKPIQLIATQNLPEDMPDFYSYYVNPTIIQLQFDAPYCIEEGYAPFASITFGDMESGYYYAESLMVDISEVASGIMSVDISNKLRRMMDMIPNYAELEEDDRPTTVVVSFDNIRSEDGNYAYSDGDGALGSYSYEYTFKELKNDIVTDFYPIINADFEGMKSIELYIRGDKGLLYDGVSFIYQSAGQEKTLLVEMKDIIREKDMFDDEAMILIIPVPTINPDAGSVVTVKLTNLRSIDGLDYSADLTATYIVKPTGIEPVTTRNDQITVYSLNGVRLMKDADKASLTKLRRGIYIINGEKRAIR